MQAQRITTTILLVEDDERDRRLLLGALREKYQLEVAVDYNQAKEKIEKVSFDVVFLDLILPCRQGEKIDQSGKLGLDLLRIIREQEPLTPIVVISALASVKTAMKVLQEGIVDFIVKDDLEDSLSIVLRRAELIRQGWVEQLILRRESRGLDEEQKLIYKSNLMQELVSQLGKVARTDTSVLLTGETGVGKELIAKEIHTRSPRSRSPFVTVNCGAISPSLVESELFGHEKGAFTGADKRKYGLVELAHQGTLFLDEIADLPLDLQVKLLRVLQERMIRRVGGEKELMVNIRVIAGTNKNLSQEIQEGRFREDLFFRLAMAKLEVPPLRSRPEDIESLAQHFVERFHPGSSAHFSPLLLRLLKSHPWPGNVRELGNVIQRMLLNGYVPGRVFQPADVKGILGEERQGSPPVSKEQWDLALIEKQMIISALERFVTQTEASKRLGISESQLRRKMRDFGIEQRRSRKAESRLKKKSMTSEWRTRLARLAEESDEFTTQRAIEALGGVSRETAIDHLNVLVTSGELERIGRGNYRRLKPKVKLTPKKLKQEKTS